MAEYKPLVIDSTRPNIPSTDSNGWKDFTKELHSHAKNIATGGGVDTDKIGAIVSGIPTVFARANLFKLAIESRTTGADASGSLNDYYSRLLSEWKGLIACIALQYQSIKIERIYLRYSPGIDIDQRPESIYEPKGAFGTMLFDDRAKWCETNSDDPFIDIIKFGTGADKIIVGATSPESLLFTSQSYNIKDVPANCPFITRPRDGKEAAKFIDPTSRDLAHVHDALNRSQCCTLYAYVNFLIEVAIPALASYYRSNPKLDLDTVLNNATTVLKEWLGDIAATADSLGCLEDARRASIPNVNCFLGVPFNTLFNYSEQLWASNGHIYATRDEGRIAFDPKSLLIPHDKADIAEVNFRGARNHPELVAALPVVVLPACNETDRHTFKYFSLPFTPLAVKVFGKFINELVSTQPNTNILSRLSATYSDEGTKTVLKVSLTLRLDDAPDLLPKTVKQEYVLSGSTIRDKDIVLWPNFVSSKWNKYYMYSEIPGLRPDARTSPYTIAPFAWDTADAEAMPIIENEVPGQPEQDRQPLYLNREIVETEVVRSTMRVVMDGRSQDAAYKYEIYESNKPFRGIKLTANVGNSGDTDGGFIIIDYATGHLNNKLNTERDSRLEDVSVGIDFGSTNTSVAYCNPQQKSANDNSQWLSGLTLHNRRVHLFTQPQADDRPTPRDIFFFPRMDVPSNSLKSILAVHDTGRLSTKGGETTQQQRAEVTGGFPCFETNLPIKQVTENGLFLSYDLPTGTQDARLSYNMKWSSYDLDQAHIRAYLRGVMLCTYAELFDKGLQPIELKWSYPSSMEIRIVRSYQSIWAELKHVLPIVGGKELQVDMPQVAKDTSDVDGIFTSGGNTAAGGAANPFGGGAAQQQQASPFGGGAQASPFGGGGAQGSPFGGGAQGSPFGGGAQQQPAAPAQPAVNAVNPFERNLEQSFGAVQLTELSEQEPPMPTTHVPLPMEHPLTESEAVAAFIADKNLNNDELALCFDVGGSTTDFSVLCKINGRNTMVKQNSIRFAAQRVSAAAVHSTRFKAVIEDLMREVKSLRLDPAELAEWHPKTDNSKASYYFEKVVDSLSPAELPLLYRKIIAQCPELFAVNLYVTGLIMFYAGQITYRLIRDLQGSGVLRNPTVTISFAGKGARIFEWLYYVDANAFQNYFLFNMFGTGIKDGRILSAIPKVNVPLDKISTDGSNTVVSDIKYEVSKGLALTFRPDLFNHVSSGSQLWTFKDLRAIEIVGEENFVLRNSRGEFPLQFDSSMTGERMRALGNAIYVASGAMRYPLFRRFCELYYGMVNNLIRLDGDRFGRALDDMKVEDYIARTKEYIDAENACNGDAGKFEFMAPLIIMEGMCFYDNQLFGLLSNN